MDPGSILEDESSSTPIVTIIPITRCYSLQSRKRHIHLTATIRSSIGRRRSSIFSYIFLQRLHLPHRNHRICERLLKHEHQSLRRHDMAPGGSTSKRGFASMDSDRQREIASKGGKSVPAEKRSFSQDRELASEAGRKGGQASGGTRSNQE